MEFQIAFHVQEDNQAGAEEWRRRAKAILDAHKDELVAPRMIGKPDGSNANVGSYCDGHVMMTQGQSQESTGPASVLQMGPRQ